MKMIKINQRSEFACAQHVNSISIVDVRDDAFPAVLHHDCFVRFSVVRWICKSKADSLS
ncbi:hypothetical protein OLMES_1376 [Oleiphilus messinensis]|uniref:Uncharacterized protein n=1 Tax=Oleiphilus messinensis TaxID=141451 RepID=A0A1Y0I7S7_9GAMM|nr:hypothetical protein OLMES_1376 [Oleiphilus messinensis]